MGIDTHSLNLLRYATAKHGGLGRTVTLGRMAVLLGPRAAATWAGTRNGAWAEPMLTDKFGATRVDSLDNSAYEGASIIADMNHPLPSGLKGQYDGVLDFGCTEHIFDVAQSMRNVASLCKLGGLILHAVPANGFCGHGFYQFSPELFFSMYSDANGFRDTEVYFADLTDRKHWYRISRPADGKRINIRSSDELYVMVVTRRVAEATLQIQQSDYVTTWQASTTNPLPPHAPSRYAGLRELLAASRHIGKLMHRVDSIADATRPKTLRQHRSCTRVTAPPPVSGTAATQ